MLSDDYVVPNFRLGKALSSIQFLLLEIRDEVEFTNGLSDHIRLDAAHALAALAKMSIQHDCPVSHDRSDSVWQVGSPAFGFRVAELIEHLLAELMRQLENPDQFPDPDVALLDVAINVGYYGERLLRDEAVVQVGDGDGSEPSSYYQPASGPTTVDSAGGEL